MASDEEIEFIVDSEETEPGDASELDADLDDADVDDVDSELDDLTGETDDDSDDPVAAALRPGAPPLLLLHRAHQYAGVLPRVIGDITKHHAGALHVGVVAPMPRMTPRALNAFLTSTVAAPIRIADPEAFARADSFGPTMTQQRDDKPFVGASMQPRWDYFTRQQPPGWTESWVEEVLDLQRAAGATVLLTPGVWADPVTPVPSLATMRQHAEWARLNVTATEHLAVNMTIPSIWLTSATLRDRLLNEIIDMHEDVFYIRVRWPLMPQPYGQVIEPAILDGYVEFANVFEENDKVLLLPNTGLTGWASLAWGAHGFSTGIGAGERAFADTRVIRIKRTGPRPAPTNRTFVPSILHNMDTTTATRLESVPGVTPCRCRYCVRQRALPFSKELAGAHYLRGVAALTARAATHSHGRRAGVRQAVRSARAVELAAATTVPLTKANVPRHLALWAERLK